MLSSAPVVNAVYIQLGMVWKCMHICMESSKIQFSHLPKDSIFCFSLTMFPEKKNPHPLRKGRMQEMHQPCLTKWQMGCIRMQYHFSQTSTLL